MFREMSKKSRLRTPFDSQHAKGSQTLLEYPTQHFLSNFFITLDKTELENVSINDM